MANRFPYGLLSFGGEDDPFNNTSMGLLSPQRPTPADGMGLGYVDPAAGVMPSPGGFGGVSAMAPGNASGGSMLRELLAPPHSGGSSADIPRPGAVEAGPASMPPQMAQQPPMQLPGATPPSPMGSVPSPMAQGQGGPQGEAPGFMDKLSTVLGGLYGAGGPGDGLITMGAGIASRDGWGKGLQQAGLIMQQQQAQRAKAAGQNQTALLIHQKTGMPLAQAEGLMQSGGAGPILSQLFRAPAAPQLVDVRNPDGSVTQKWMRPGEAEGTAVGAAKPAETVRTITDPEQRRSLGVPADYNGPVQVDASGKLMLPGKASTEVKVGAGETEFDKKLGGGQAEFFSTTASDAVNARADLGRVQILRGQIDKLPGGFLGGAQALASQYGVKIGPNASNLETANAIISQLVPTQRVPGSGTTSDRDLELFKSALPKLSNTREGNALIMDTMEGMAKYKMAQGEIATKVITGEMSRADGIRAIQGIPDPFEGLKRAMGGQGGASSEVVRVNSPDEARRLPKGTRIVLPDGREGVVP